MPKTITSLKNPRVQSALKLRGRRSRARQGRIVVDGARELLRALEAGLDLAVRPCAKAWNVAARGADWRKPIPG